MTSPVIMGSPARRHTNPITRCWAQPHYRYAGTDDGRGTDQTLDTKRLTRRTARWGQELSETPDQLLIGRHLHAEAAKCARKLRSL